MKFPNKLKKYIESLDDVNLYRKIGKIIMQTIFEVLNKNFNGIKLSISILIKYIYISINIKFNYALIF